MTDAEFRAWILEMRSVIAYAWDDLGLPPKVGPDEAEIKDQFKRLLGYPVHEFEQPDNVIRNTQTNLGMAVNSWFPTMMKTRINNTYGSYHGKSIYDHFVKDSLIERCYLYGHRHFKRDSFYHYSLPIWQGQMVQAPGVMQHRVTSAEEFLIWYEANRQALEPSIDYWIKPEKDGQDYSGYTLAVKSKTFCTITRQSLEQLKLPIKVLRNVYEMPEKCRAQPEDFDLYRVMLFPRGQKIFPVGFKAFRISWCQYPVNYPPLTAKYIYQRYTEHCKDQEQVVVYDPSMGWGGRIIGAMSVTDDRQLHYIGTDPNEDHTIILENGSKSTKYADVADYYNSVRNNGTLIPHTHSYEIYQLGSEVIHQDPGFQKWKGKVDLVFTSPPYFNREAYSEDETQSYKKFPHYEEWRDGFLHQTLKTAYEWLRPNRYLVWNISDLRLNKTDFINLVDDTKEICDKLGFKFIDELKMTLAQMPGANRVGTRAGTAKYTTVVSGHILKFEPILIFKKEE